jgi:hypothetical protein
MDVNDYSVQASLYYAKSANSKQKGTCFPAFRESRRGRSLRGRGALSFLEAVPLKSTRNITSAAKSAHSMTTAPFPYPSREIDQPETRPARSAEAFRRAPSMKGSDMPLAQSATLAIKSAIFRQRQVLEVYCFSLPRGEGNVRDMILKDIDSFSDLGASRQVSDLSEVLKQFDLAHPSMPAPA